MIDRLKYMASLFLLSTTFGELGLNKVLSKSSSAWKGFTNVAICVFASVDLLGMNKRLVTLDIDNHVIPFAYFLISFVATVRTAAMLIGGHDDLAAEGFNRILYADIVGSYANGV